MMVLCTLQRRMQAIEGRRVSFPLQWDIPVSDTMMDNRKVALTKQHYSTTFRY